MCKEEQEEAEPPHIKEEQEEPLLIFEAAPGSTLTFLAVKSEGEDENRETEPVAGTSTEHMETGADVEDCGTSQPTSDEQLLSPHCSESDLTEHSDEREETREGQSAVNTLDSHQTQNVEGQTLSSSHKPSQDQTLSKQTHSTKRRTGERRFSCTECGKMFNDKGHLKRHNIVHTGEKPFTCTVCAEDFGQISHLKSHMMNHICLHIHIFLLVCILVTLIPYFLFEVLTFLKFYMPYL